MRDILARIIQNMGFEVDSVKNGREAVEAAGKSRYSLIVLDGMMPELSGLEAARAIRQIEHLGPSVPIIGISGSIEINQDVCREAGMNDFLTKPPRIQAIRDVVQRWTSEDSHKDSAA